MNKILAFILFSMIAIGIEAQGYVPEVGETIVFYPLTEKAKQKYLGYDCFYDATQVLSNGEYKFKRGARYKCNRNGLTPFDEIEGKTFKVLKAENYIHKGKQENKVFLLFLSCVENGAEIVLRIPFFEKNASFLTKKLIVEIEEGDTYRARNLYVNLPCIPISYIKEIREKFQGENLLYEEVIEKNFSVIPDYNKTKKRKRIIENISLSINLDVVKNVFDIERCRKCIDVRFEECNISIYAHPFAICTYHFGTKTDTVKVPLTYMAGETSYFNKNTSTNYLFENFFTIKRDELKSILSEGNNLWIIETFSGKKVYYGANGIFDYKDEGLSKYVSSKIRRLTDNSIYVLKEGIYDCLTFDVYKDSRSGNDVYAILEDSLGVRFRVPVTSPVSNPEYLDLVKKHRLLLTFQDCFMLVNEAYTLKEKQRLLTIQKEKEEKERYALWVKKYGATYAEYINKLSEMKREKFERLVSKYGKVTAKLMVEGKVKLGWSKQMCIESWGEPDDINRTIGSWGTHEQWVYGEIYCDYLYFENGVLTTIQN